MSRGVQQVKELIKSKKVVVVSKSWCGFCRMAKQTLAKYNISQDNLAVLEIDGWDDCDDVQVGLLRAKKSDLDFRDFDHVQVWRQVRHCCLHCKLFPVALGYDLPDQVQSA